MGVYIDKLEFHNLLKEYKHIKLINDMTEEDSKRLDRVYNKIGKYFLLIAKNYLNKPRFINYSDDWKDDMISEAVFDMVRYIDNYNVELMDQKILNGKNPEPFSYFTQYVFNGGMRFLSKSYKDNEVLIRLPFIENMDKGLYE